VNVVLVARFSRSPDLTRRMATATLVVLALGLIAAVATVRWAPGG
jgi:hypothetical protein